MSQDALAISTKKFLEEETVRAKLLYPDEKVIRFIKKNANKDDTILDFGCGFGRHALAFSFDNFKNVIAMDYNNPCLEHIKEEADKHHLNIQCIQNSESSVPLEPNSVDVVVASGSLYTRSQEDLEHLLSKLCNVMKPEGLLWCDFRTPKDDLIKSGIKHGKNYVNVHRDNTEVGYFSAEQDELKAIFEKAGFEIVSLDTFDFTRNNQQLHDSWYILNVKKAS